MERIKVVAEICCNHNGDIETAKKMILLAKENNAYAVKFQKRDIDYWRDIKKNIYNVPHKNPENSYGATYYEHRKTLEFDVQTHKILYEFCHKHNIKVGCSVFDIKSAKEIIQLNIDFIKIASPCNNNFELIRYIYEHYSGEVHISFGMTTFKELDEITNLIYSLDGMNRTVLHVCTSGYPLEASDVNLLDISKFVEMFGNDCKAVGYSGHQSSLAIDFAAYTLGASYLERHFTLDKSQRGTDHKLAILPSELNIITKGCEDIFQAMHTKNEDILEVEKENRSKLKWE